MSPQRSYEFDYQRVVDRFSACRTAPQRSHALQLALSTYNLASIAYLADNVPGLTDRGPYIAVTYSDAWVDHYRRRDFVKIDPAVKAGFRSMLPVDWKNFDLSDRRLTKMWGEAREHGIGRNGLSIPIRGKLGERGVLTITTNDSDLEWKSSLGVYMRDFMILAVHLHQSILDAEKVDRGPINISERERECLKWAAAGKTYSEIASILTISHHTTKTHLDTARHKLNALNMPHAVAQALSLGII